MKLFQWILGAILIIAGLTRNNELWFLSILISSCGILLIPPISNFIRFKFYQNKILRRIYKISISILGFMILLISVGIMEEKNLSENINLETEINSFYNNLENSGNIENLLFKASSKFNENKSILTNSQKTIFNEISFVFDFMSLELNSNSFAIKSMQMDSVEEGLSVNFLENYSLNKFYNEEVKKHVKTKENFSSISEYYIYRAKIALNNNEEEYFQKYYDKLLKKNRDLLIPKFFILHVLKNDTITNSQFQSSKKYIIHKYKDDEELMLELGRYYYRNQNNKSALKYFLKGYEINPVNSETLKKIGMLYELKNYKKSAIKFYSKYLENRNDYDICEKMRELTKYVSSWYKYRVCCDGTTSNAWGRGACSHHGGVCRNGKDPIYGYKYNCN